MRILLPTNTTRKQIPARNTLDQSQNLILAKTQLMDQGSIKFRINIHEFLKLYWISV